MQAWVRPLMWYHTTSRFFLGAYLVYDSDKNWRGIAKDYATAEKWCNTMNMAAELREIAEMIARLTRPNE